MFAEGKHMVPLATTKTPRLLSLDVLRGMIVALMILANNAGDGTVSYAQLRHSIWDGCTLTDFIFPAFLFIVGCSVDLSLGARLLHASRGAVLRQVLRRAVLIFAIGLTLNALPNHLHDLRVFGVLQRIALCYLATSIIYLWGGIRGCALAAVLALLGYWILLTRVPVPGFGLPGVDVTLLDPQGNLSAWLDRTLLSPKHLYHNSFYDPEGLLSTVPAVATTVLGVLAAAWLRTRRPLLERSTVLLGWGLALTASGLLWSWSLPLNKRLWTGSFVLFTGGAATAALALLALAIDNVQQLHRFGRIWRVWLPFGMNALMAYIFSELLAILLGVIPVSSEANLQQALFRALPGWLGSASDRSVIYSVMFVIVCYLPAVFLYRRRIFVKL
jgi:predicted acyltransferase